MMILITIITVSLSIIFIILLFTINIYNKLNNMRQMKANLSQEVSNLKQKLENRKAFRVNLPLEKCEFEIVKVGEEPGILNKYEQGKIKDLSMGGMKLITEIDLPVRKHVVLTLFFNLYGKEYKLNGIVKRKNEFHLESKFTYGIEFKNVDSRTKRTLYRLLNNIEIERKKAKNEYTHKNGR
ncbi:PilZ domain-containing protein [Filobacillus milosensis]|uniref:PilZ domain-containing protein n=1 Tax=Filobacillus milosensis TaxID=94137 RepID=A0A4Y8IDZ9_9BACI|nr:PilZ domain-containing protein [Filobacillus milosensis]TFB13288.1 PilZ domain-containing protein [Filobacillus milosensis]